MPSHDWFTKFTRAWAAGFACQIIVTSAVGYLLLCLTPAQQYPHSLGSTLLVFSEIAVIPSAIYTAIVAALAVALSARLKTAVIASGAVSFASLVILFLAAGYTLF